MPFATQKRDRRAAKSRVNGRNSFAVKNNKPTNTQSVDILNKRTRCDVMQMTYLEALKKSQGIVDLLVHSHFHTGRNTNTQILSTSYFMKRNLNGFHEKIMILHCSLFGVDDYYGESGRDGNSMERSSKRKVLFETFRQAFCDAPRIRA